MRIILLVASLFASVSMAAPLCRGVLTPSLVSAESANRAIESLAELRMNLDLTKLLGVTDPTIKAMELDYERKVQEIAKHLQTSDFEIRASVRYRIPQMQKTVAKKQEDIIRTRDSEKKNLLPLFEAKEGITDLHPDFATKNVPRWIELIEDRSKLVFEQNYDLLALDLKTNTVETIAEKVQNSVISKDSKVVFAISEIGILETYSTDTLLKMDSVKLGSNMKQFDLDQIWRVMAVNEKGDRVAVGYELSTVLIFDTKTGKLVGKVTPDKDQEVGLSFAFTSNTELVIASGKTLAKYDLQTKDLKVNAGFSGWRAMSLAVNNARGELTMVMNSKQGMGTKTYFARSDDLKVTAEFDGQTYHHIAAPGSKQNLTLVSTSENPLGLYESSDLKTPMFDFQQHYLEGHKIPYQLQFSHDGNSIFVFYTGPQSNIKTIQGVDIWKRNLGPDY